MKWKETVFSLPYFSLKTDVHFVVVHRLQTMSMMGLVVGERVLLVGVCMGNCSPPSLPPSTYPSVSTFSSFFFVSCTYFMLFSFFFPFVFFSSFNSLLHFTITEGCRTPRSMNQLNQSWWTSGMSSCLMMQVKTVFAHFWQVCCPQALWYLGHSE